MIKGRIIPTTWVLALLVFAFSSCEKTSEGDNGYDRKPLLENYANNLIIPAYTSLQTSVNDLQSKINTLNADVSEANLVAAQNAWKAAYLKWQYANSYNFGPAAEEGLQKSLVEEIGTFPVSTTKINNAITTGTYNLNDFNRDARGFLAAEHLLFSLTDDQASVLQSLQDQTRRQYLADVTGNIKTKVDAVLNTWNTSYKTTFLSNTGTDVGSSVSALYNEFVKSFESIKNFKVALPLGLRPGQVQTEPTKVEAYYSGTSIEMLKAHYDAVEDIWYGRDKNGNDGPGFREYLEETVGGPALIISTEAQMNAIRTALASLDNQQRLSAQLATNPEPVNNVHTELQNHIRFFKSDLSSLLGIVITYSSGDGD